MYEILLIAKRTTPCRNSRWAEDLHHDIVRRLPDGSKRYEFVDPDNDMSMMQQINLGLKLHGAVSAHPVQPTLFGLEPSNTPPE